MAGVATFRPAGKLSVKSKFVAVSTLALLSIVKRRVVVRLSPIASGLKLLVQVGGGSTVRAALAGSATTRPDAERLPVVLVYVPALVVAGTCKVTLKVHELLGDSVLFDKVTTDVPLRVEPLPHTSFLGKSVATRPEITDSKLSVKTSWLCIVFVATF